MLAWTLKLLKEYNYIGILYIYYMQLYKAAYNPIIGIWPYSDHLGGPGGNPTKLLPVKGHSGLNESPGSTWWAEWSHHDSWPWKSSLVQLFTMYNFQCIKILIRKILFFYGLASFTIFCPFCDSLIQIALSGKRMATRRNPPETTSKYTGLFMYELIF